MRDDGREAEETKRATASVVPRRLRALDTLWGWARPSDRAARRLRLDLAAEWLADTVRRELDDGLALPGLVVLFALGIVAYFRLPAEPWLPAVVAAAVVAVTATTLRRRTGHPARIAAALTAVLLGVAAAALETARVAAPRLDHERTVTVEGRVVDLDATARGGLRLTVDVARMEGRGLEPSTTPTRITATLSGHGWRPEVGDGVRFKARLKPPEGPVMPGGYDFARRAWFEGRGAGGYVLGRASPIDLGPEDWTSRFLRPIGGLRHTIAERVRAALPGATGAIGAALIVGEQRAIPDEVAEPLRASGLTHIVSISGLHMSLVAGGVIVAVRAFLALFPGLALGFPIKKWAAAAAFVAATIYLLLSGNQVAALRSHLMLSVALLAVMVDRPAVTMHTVAVSAALILAVEPSAVMEPSFQMSYLAVIALVAAYDLYRAWSVRRPPPRDEPSLAGHLLGSGLRHLEGFAFSSLVAGLATAPVIAGVFFRAAPYSIPANMAVLPVTGLLTMPAAVAGTLAMPFGLERWPLWAMGLGIDWMIAVGRWAAAMPGGAGWIGAPHAAAMPLGIVAVLWLSAWKSRLRLLGLVPALAAIAALGLGPRPDVLIGRHGSPIAVRGPDGALAVLGETKDRFDVSIWLAADADPRPVVPAALADGWSCDTTGCVFTRPVTGPGLAPDARLEIAVVRHPDAFAEDCRRAALVITPLVAPPGCREWTTVVDRIDLAHNGAATVDFTGPLRPMAADPQVAHDRAGPAPSRLEDDPTDDTTGDRVDLDVAPSGAGSVDPSTVARHLPDPTASARRSDPGVMPATAAASSTQRPGTYNPPHRGVPDTTLEEPPDPPTLRRDVHMRVALPTPPRPWTPVDPRIDRLARDAVTASTAGRSVDTPTGTRPPSTSALPIGTPRRHTSQARPTTAATSPITDPTPTDADGEEEGPNDHPSRGGPSPDRPSADQ